MKAPILSGKDHSTLMFDLEKSRFTRWARGRAILPYVKLRGVWKHIASWAKSGRLMRKRLGEWLSVRQNSPWVSPISTCLLIKRHCQLCPYLWKGVGVAVLEDDCLPPEQKVDLFPDWVNKANVSSQGKHLADSPAAPLKLRGCLRSECTG